LGVEVEEFGIGFPPRLMSFKRNGVTYSINWIPIGGFVKIKGESGDQAEDPNSFSHQKTWKKSIILSAGVIMNFFVAFILLSIGFFIGLPQAIDENTPLEDVSQRNVMIMEVVPDSPADIAGIEIGDKILAINQQEVLDSDFIYQFILDHEQEELGLTIQRNEELLELTVQPRIIEVGQPPMVGVGMLDTGVVSYGFFGSIWQGAKGSVMMTIRIVQAFYQLLVDLFTTGQLSPGLAGPVGVAIITGQVVQLGFVYILNFAAILSLNLAVLNILPFPALDGGRLLFAWVEKIRGRKISERIEAWIHNSGFVLLMLLIVFVTWRDVSKYGGQIWTAVKNIF
jgi:regulator of sigma E protease